MGYIIDIAYNNVTDKNVNGKDVHIPIDWSLVTDVDAAITKVSELNFTDETFIPNWHGIGALNIPRGGYHYFRNNQPFYNSGKQARTFANAIVAQGIKDNDVFVLDNEEKDSKGNPIVSLAQSLDWFYNVRIILGLKDYSRFWLYSTADILNGLRTDKLSAEQLAILKSINIWVAGYPNDPPTGEWLTALPVRYTITNPAFGPTIGWQHSENVIVPGIPGGTDVNQIDQNYFMLWKGASVPAPVPTPAPTPTPQLFPVTFQVPFSGLVTVTVNPDGTWSKNGQ